MSAPPPPNPFKSAYESFISETPFITRTVIFSYTIVFVISIFFPLSTIKNIPYFTIFRFEIYRLLFSNFACDSLLSLIFGFMSFVQVGKRLEYSFGSTNFASVLLIVGIGSNLIFTVVSLVAYFCAGRFQPHLMHECGGLWQMIFGVIALECSYEPEGSKRRLFFTEIPTIYYPFALLFIFVVFFSFNQKSILFGVLPYLYSIWIGYAFGFGKLEFLKMGIERRRNLESGKLRSVANRPDWVAGPTNEDWVMISSPASVSPRENKSADAESGWSPTIIQPQKRTTSNCETNANFGVGNRLGSDLSTESSTAGGTVLTNRRSSEKNSPTREVLVSAAERRAKEQSA